MERTYKFIISGGGTGGHIFPAIAIANGLKRRIPNAEILFIGAKDKMEMTKVPEAGYPIEGLEIMGMKRGLSWANTKHNFKLPFQLFKSMRKAKKIILDYNPDAVIGVGGYASGPTLEVATSLDIPCLIQEQNSFPGVTNKMLSTKVQSICVAYPHLDQYFPKEKIIYTGNPVRLDIINVTSGNQEAYSFFNFSPEKKTIIIIGGSLGALSINNCIKNNLDILLKENIQIIWQTGENYFKNLDEDFKQKYHENIRILPFIKRMDYAYSIADVIISRAGALAISELCIIGKACILIPFPNAAEDHQTKNAQVLSEQNAAVLIPDHETSKKLIPEITKLIHDEDLQKNMGNNIKHFAMPDAVERIVNEILKLTKHEN